MKKLNEKLHTFLIDDSGIDTIFKVVGQIVASAAIFKIVPFISNGNLPIAILSAFFSVVLFSLAFYNGLQKFWKPLMIAIYGEKEELSKLEVIGGFKSFIRPQPIIFLLGSLVFFWFANSWFKAIYELSIK